MFANNNNKLRSANVTKARMLYNLLSEKRITTLSMFTTKKCNYRCIYCCTDAGKRSEHELTLDEKKRIISEAKQMGAHYINICGKGEPLLDDDLGDLINYVSSLKMRCVISTNGSVITPSLSKELRRNGIYINYKLNSLRKTTYEEMVGIKNAVKWREYEYGNVKNMMIPEGLYNLLECGYLGDKGDGIVPSLMIESVMTKRNYRDIIDVAILCKNINATPFFERVAPKGERIKKYRDIILSDLEYKRLFITLIKRKYLGHNFMLGEMFRICYVERNPLIDEEGNVLVCFARSDKGYGNIRNENLPTLFENIKRNNKTRYLKWYSQCLSLNFKKCNGINSCEGCSPI